LAPPYLPFFQNLSKLESLSLTQTPLYPALLTIGSLVELKLTGYTIPFQFNTFLGLLASNAGLELVVLDIQFVPGSVGATPASRMVPLAHLRRLSITCSKPIDSRGLLSHMGLPRGVHIEVLFTQPAQSTELRSFLPSPLTPIWKLLAPITTIKTRNTPREIHYSGNSSELTLRSTEPTWRTPTELALFPTTAVREFYADLYPYQYVGSGVSHIFRCLPALETFAISKSVVPAGLFSALTEEPVLCPTLKTIAFFDCAVDSDIAKKLEKAIAKRGDLTAARLYRVVIVNSTGTLPDLASIQHLRRVVPCVEVRVDDKLPDLS
jgi:hypothetical protein